MAWLRANCKLSGGAAAERVAISRQLQHLPETLKAFAGGNLGYQHAVVLARAAEHVGVAAVRQQETQLLKVAATTDPGHFAGVAKDFEHRVDAGAVLAEANRAYERRYLHIGEPVDGTVRIDGLVDTEAGAIIRNAVTALTLPSREDLRTPGQRRADALVEVCRRGPGPKAADGAGPRPQLVIKASAATLTKSAGSPAGEIDGAASSPPRPFAGMPATRRSRGSSAPGSWNMRSATPAGRSRPPLVGRWQHATITASSIAAIGRRSGVMGIT